MAGSASERLTEAVHRLGARRDDQAAWETLFTLSWPTALATAHRIFAGQMDLAADAAQESFVRIVRYADFAQIRDGPSFLAYLRTVCRHTSLDLRGRLLDRQGPAADVAGPLRPDASGPSPGRPFAPEEGLRRDELRDELLRGLDADERKLLQMMMDERSLAEIASELGISYGNAGVRVHRLRAKLRKTGANRKAGL